MKKKVFLILGVFIILGMSYFSPGEIIFAQTFDEIQEEFARIYRRYKILNRKKVGEFFFKEIDGIVKKLCDDFEATICDEN